MELICAALALCAVIACCLLGLFSSSFHDNLLQCLGMALLGIWCFTALDRMLDRGWVRPESLILYLGLAAYAVGTALKVIQYQRKKGAIT